jgi:N-methylhydantoinase B
MSLDPFTVEIIRHQLIAAAEESFVILGRSSQSPIIYEVLDYACAITDRFGNLIAQANGVPGFLGTLSFAVKAVLDKYPAASLHPGDTLITNDPYTGGGTHLSDVALVAPIFEAGELIAFSVNKAHWTEVGGMAAGSWTTDSTEIYQEGLQFPILYIGRDYKLDQALIDLIKANVRTPERTVGDLYAGVASLRTAEGRVKEISARYGVQTFESSVAEILNHGERMARLELSRLPKGTYAAEDWMDDDGLSGDPVYVRVKVSISKEEFVCDFSGSSPQVPGAINCTITRLYSACRSIFKAITDPGFPANDGWFRPVRVVCPEGTVFTARRPAPVSTYWETGAYACDLLWHALFPIAADRLTAGHFLSICGTIVSGKDEKGEDFILVEPQAGGWGAGATKDGESGLVAVGDGETYMLPVEICEARYPLRVEQYMFNTAPMGAGKYRGGFGLVREYRILCKDARLTATFGRHSYPPWGAMQGQEGSANGVLVLHHGGQRTPTCKGKLARHPLKAGDRVRLITAVGGGYGLAREREPAAVREDVLNGLLSRKLAREIYGVFLDPETLEIDELKTKKLRSKA